MDASEVHSREGVAAGLDLRQVEDVVHEAEEMASLWRTLST